MYVIGRDLRARTNGFSRKLAEKAHETVLALRQEMEVFRVEEKAAGTVVLSEMRSEYKRQKHLEYLNEERKQGMLIS